MIAVAAVAPMDIGIHFILEMLGAGALLCSARLCRHEGCRDRPRGPVRRALSTRTGSAGLWVTLTLATSTATVMIVG